ncbi:hypothetical protein [Fluviicola taffensis]|uniref:hypothetical protein n=1 Tax=Fluviicola taffensis TaxID=191579 RepID=UPI0031379A1F
MNLDQHFIAYLNTQAATIQTLVKKKTNNGIAGDLIESLSERIPVADFGPEDIIKGEIFSVEHSDKGELIQKWLITSPDEKIGFDKAGYEEYKKLLNAIYKRKEINELVAYRFLEVELFKWFLFKREEGSTTFSDDLIELIKSNISEMVYCFPVAMVQISNSFEIGPVQIRYFTEEDFDRLSESTPGDITAVREHFQGKVVVCTTVSAQKDRASEIALEKCSLAIDLLKISSNTLYMPDLDLVFDIDSRAKNHEVTTIISHGLNFESFNFTDSATRFIALTDEYFFEMNGRGLDILSRFVFEDSTESELCGLIINAITNFASALSNPDLHQRIASSCSIFESLLLNNENVGILSSLQKYCPKLVTPDPEIRNSIMELLKRVYEIRSVLVHHGKRKHIDLTELSNFQQLLFSLILNLMHKTESHQTKASLLNEIDEAINRAY